MCFVDVCQLFCVFHRQILVILVFTFQENIILYQFDK